jgi:hypothetical protein
MQEVEMTAPSTVPPIATGQDIHAIARAIEAHIAAHWEALLHEHDAKLRDAYEKAGDMAYGTYLTLLFNPVHRQLRSSGLHAAPSLPGNFEISREWGVLTQDDEQRWMWSTIETTTGAALGTIVTITFHDHTRFRLPRAPQIIALKEVGKEAVVAALAQRSANFGAAREASIEIAEYLQSLEQQG